MVYEPVFPLIDAPSASAASVPVVSLLKSGLDVMAEWKAKICLQCSLEALGDQRAVGSQYGVDFWGAQ